MHESKKPREVGHQSAALATLTCQMLAEMCGLLFSLRSATSVVPGPSVHNENAYLVKLDFPLISLTYSGVFDML